MAIEKFRFEDLTYSERAELRGEDPALYKTLKESFERRAAAEIRRGILTREHRVWLHKLAVAEGKKQLPNMGGKAD